jgi:hypothetical protein
MKNYNDTIRNRTCDLPVHGYHEFFYVGLKWPEGENDHSLSSSVKVNVCGAIWPLFLTCSFYGAMKHKENFMTYVSSGRFYVEVVLI